MQGNRFMATPEADFYELVHATLKQHGLVDDRPQSRRHERTPYPFQQKIAPYVNGRLPIPEMFAPVRCLDLSPSGFSYLANSPEEADSLVVALGKDPQMTYLSAQIIHQTPMTLIGCRFSGRLHIES